MKVSLNWLHELIDYNYDPQTLSDKLTLSGSECASVEQLVGNLDNVVVAEVVSCQTHPNAEKLKVCEVSYGKNKSVTIVCGAPNVKQGMKSALALPGAVLQGKIKIKPVDKFGVKSEGMLCSEAELSISDDEAGIIDLDAELTIGTPLQTALSLDDYVIDIELTPDRPDCLSHIGIAREIGALNGSKIKYSKIDIKETTESASDFVKISIADPDACPRYTARVIRNVKIGKSPWWLKQRLLAAGIRSINNIVDITNYVMMEYGHPLHAFDFDNFKKPEVLVRRATKDEKFTTLDNLERQLNEDVLLITDGVAPVAIGGIMGGQFSEVSEKTTNILLESAYFEPTIIRRGSKFLGLQSESQHRFERGCDPEIVPTALNRAAYLIQELAGGEVLQGIVDCYPKKIKPILIKLRPERVNKILATDLSSVEITDILKSLDFDVSGEKILNVKVPTFRPDIEREIDLIEEVARIYGYDKIAECTENNGDLVTPRFQPEVFNNQLRELLTSQGYFETITSSLGDPEQIKVVAPQKKCIEVLNPISNDYKWLRPNMINTSLNVIRHNLNRRVLSIKIFEIGNVFTQSKVLANEELHLAFAMSGSDRGENWLFHPGNFSFYDITGILELIATQTSMKISYQPTENIVYNSGCSFDIQLGDQIIGNCGQIDKKILKIFDIKSKVFYTELTIKPLFENRKGVATYQPLPKYPSSERDIALVVDEQLITADLMNTIKESADQILKDVLVFDLYKGKQLEKGKKSIAFRLIFRDESKTLTDKEIDNVYNRIVDKLKIKHSASLRD